MSDPAAAVTISANDVPYAEGNTLAEAALLPAGTFSVKATATSGRFLRRLTLVFDGVRVGFFTNGATSGTLDYTTNIPGNHLVEALATDDLGVTGAAPPVRGRVLPNAPGRLFEMTKSGDWNTAGNWIDILGNTGVPGPNDFAVVGSFNSTLAANTTVNGVSLDGGSIANSSTIARTLTATGFCTIAGGQVKSNLTLPSGSTGLLINDADIGLSGTLTYAGTVRLHGKGGITGVNLGARSRTSVAGPDGLFDFVKGVINGVGQFFADLASGGRKGSKSAPLPPPAPELRTVNVARLNISGTLAAVPAPVVSNDGGSLISQDGGGLISQDGGGPRRLGRGQSDLAGWRWCAAAAKRPRFLERRCCRHHLRLFPNWRRDESQSPNDHPPGPARLWRAQRFRAHLREPDQ